MTLLNITANGASVETKLDSQVSLVTAYGDFSGGTLYLETSPDGMVWIRYQIIAGDGTLVPVVMTEAGQYLVHVPSPNCRFNLVGAGLPDIMASVSPTSYHP